MIRQGTSMEIWITFYCIFEDMIKSVKNRILCQASHILLKDLKILVNEDVFQHFSLTNKLRIGFYLDTN